MIFLKCKHKHDLFCRGARWRVFVTWLGQLFIMFTITTSKHLGFHMLTVNSFISYAVFWLRTFYLICWLVPMWQVNIVWNRWKRWKSTLKKVEKHSEKGGKVLWSLKPRNENVKRKRNCKGCLFLFISGNIRISRTEFFCLRLIEQAIANVGIYLQIFVLPAV